MTDRYGGERILVFERRLLDELGAFQGTTREVSRYLDVILERENTHFHLRSEAEKDTRLKQIIPYVMFVCEDEIFSYIRGKQSGEARLVGNRSVGIGGHINPEDETLFSETVQSYQRAVLREITEEVVVSGPFEPELIGLINDDANPVGRVHFGVVHLCRLSHRDIRKREQQITQSGFIRITELATTRRDELETWSALAIDLLGYVSKG